MLVLAFRPNPAHLEAVHDGRLIRVTDVHARLHDFPIHRQWLNPRPSLGGVATSLNFVTIDSQQINCASRPRGRTLM